MYEFRLEIPSTNRLYFISVVMKKTQTFFRSNIWESFVYTFEIENFVKYETLPNLGVS